MGEEFNFKSKKKDWFATVCIDAVHAYLWSKFNIYYEHLNRLHPLSDKPFLLIPKHQHMYDIFLEGIVLRKVIHRNAYYIMKDELPVICEWGGGIPIMRKHDISRKEEKDMTKEERAIARAAARKLLKEARKRSRYVSKVIQYLLDNNEIVVTHPEITRNYQERGDKATVVNNLSKLLHLQRQNGSPITFVPLDFYYQAVTRRGSDIIVTVGNPIQVPNDGLDELVRHMANEIELLF